MHPEDTSEEKGEEGRGQDPGGEVPEKPSSLGHGEGSTPFPVGKPQVSSSTTTAQRGTVRGGRGDGTCEPSVSENGTQKIKWPPILALKEFTEDIQTATPKGPEVGWGKGPGRPTTPRSHRPSRKSSTWDRGLGRTEETANLLHRQPSRPSSWETVGGGRECRRGGDATCEAHRNPETGPPGQTGNGWFWGTSKPFTTILSQHRPRQ
ncbi:hypothetical protein GWK47_032142 [Chionoecetes opilio]|uniref:Uncharacterized protein n=1 Tax=Chionoecetes opilio TaxID=41210 RepID=A0A8J4YJB4_CHIOP|nr:hypothetical protein GWK47_032142 [Chionoecetes opilio]